MQKHRVLTTAIYQLLSAAMLHSQVRTLVACVIGLITGGEIGIAGIGRYLPGEAETKHKIKRVDRFCGNKLIDVGPLCRPMLMALGKKTGSLLVSVDWTKIDKFQVLVFAVTTRYGRSVPVYWEVINTEEDRMKAVEVEAVERFYAHVPQHLKLTILADRGFDEVKFIAAVAKRFEYVIRLSKSNSVSEHGEAGKPDPVFVSLASKLTERDVAVDFGEVLFTQVHRFQTRVIGKHLSGKEDPWFLATSLTERATTIVDAYARRFDIEHAFKDWKDVHHGWQLGAIRSTSTERLSRLLIIPAVAFLMMILLGMLAESRNQHRSLQVNSTKTKRCLSLWRVGVLLFKTVSRLACLSAKRLLSSLDDLSLPVVALDNLHV